MIITEKKYENTNLDDKSEFLFTTRVWINFLVKEKKGEPLVLEINHKNQDVLFVSLIFKNHGIKICGSPFEGWSTPYMGFLGISAFDDNDKLLILKNVVKYLKKEKKCHYIQISDWHIDIKFVKKYKLKHDSFYTPFLDISKTEEELFSSFKTDVRTNCRALIKRGGELVILPPSKEFAETYHKQLIDVFDKQGLKPFYSLEKIKTLMDCFKIHHDMILCESVLEPSEKKSIATGIFLGYKKRFYFFAAASYRNYQLLRPNEPVIWNAIKYWKNKGCTEFDMLGSRGYKEKFRPTQLEIPILYFQKFPLLHFAKKLAKKMVLVGRKK